MSRAERPVLLVGGVPGLEVEGVFNTVAPILGDLAIGLTDGEVGGRRLWVIYLMYELWHKHLEVEVIRESEGVADFPPGVLPQDWRHIVPQGYHDLPWFRPRRTVSKLTSEGYSTGYPAHAASSYQKFCELREHGDHLPDAPPMQFKPHGSAWDRYLRYVRELNAAVPESVPLGMHLCYGDLHHKHFRPGRFAGQRGYGESCSTGIAATHSIFPHGGTTPPG